MLRANSRVQRTAATTAEVIVGFVLVAATGSIVSQCAVGCLRVQSSQRDYEMAIDELSNNLEQLKLFSVETVEEALQELSVSSRLLRRFPDATLDGELLTDELGARVTLTLSRPSSPQTLPIKMTAWMHTTAPQNEVEDRS